MWDPEITIEEVNDPVEIEKSREGREQFRLNSDWLQAHWSDLLPQARGKHLAVANKQAFIADTAEAAWAWAEKNHPNDKGPLVQFVMPHDGPRIYSPRVVYVDPR